MFFCANGIGIENRLLVAVAAELVNTGHQGLIVAHCHRILLDAPRRRDALTDRLRYIVRHAPVCADNAIKMIFVAQQANLISAEGTADLLPQ